MKCASENCSSKVKGYDIEKAYDVDNHPVYAVYYECAEGHKFVAEYDRASDLVKDLAVLSEEEQE